MLKGARTTHLIPSSTVAAAIAALAISACSNSSFYNALGNKAGSTKLVIFPSSDTLPVNGTITFGAAGGVKPYTFSIVSGSGTINTSTGLYTAPGAAAAATIGVQDKEGSTATASVTITSTTGPLTLVPSSVSLNVNGRLTFVATGGTPPYSYSIQTAGTGSPTVNGSTGAYAAGSSIGTDTVKVTDSSTPTPATSTAAVTTTTASTGVDNSIPSETLPASGTGGKALPGGYSFTIRNAGPANGAQSISWWVFLSPTPTPGSGTVLLQSGTNAALTAGGSVSIPLSWTWPSVAPSGQTGYLFIMIQAGDDLTTGNNTYTGPAITIAAPNVDYTVPGGGVASTGSLVAGSGLTATFTLSNSGTDNGSQTVSWTAYVSTSSANTIDASCVVLDSGTATALAAGGTQGVGFTGTWPSTPATYYLKVKVSAADDVNTANDTQVSGPYSTTYVDYTITGVTNTGGTVAGAALSGSFTVSNAGTANGSQTVSWTVFASLSSTLGAGSTVVTSGTTTALGAGASAPVSFSGTWPAAAGTYYLIAVVSAADDVTSANNTRATAAGIAVSAASVDYVVSAITYTGGVANPAGAVNGSFSITNNGPNNGTQYVTWQVYASRDTTLDGSDSLVASGTTAPMAAGAGPLPVAFSGQWPLTYGSYYLIVKATVPVDVDTNIANNTAATAGTTTIGVYNEDAFEPNDDTALSNAYNLGITLQPGMSIKVTGSMPLLDAYDIMEFNTGTASAVSFSWNWTSSTNVNLYVLNGPNTSIDGVGINGATSLSLFWTVDAGATNRWVALNAASAVVAPGAQTLIITAY